MRKERFKRPRLVLILWGLTIAAVFSLSVAANVSLANYMTRVRVQDPGPHLDAAEQFMNRNSVPEAWAELRKAEEKAPEDPRVHKVSGDLHFREREWLPAFETYAKAIEKGSDAPGVFSNSLWALIELQRHSDAIALGEKYIEKGLQEPIIYRYTAEAYIRAGERVKAIPFLEGALKRYVKDLYLMRQLVAAYRSVGRNSKADELQRHIREIEASIPATRGGS